MQSRLEFVCLVEQGGVSVAELCRRFGISRQTGYAYIQRYRELGEAGLADRSRRPLSSPAQCPHAVQARILALRMEHPGWGGRKLARRLRDLEVADVPSPSTVTQVLRRHGRLDPKEADKHRAFKRFERAAPNELWQMDFKGHVAMDVGRCHPLTVLDDHSRFSIGLLACGDEQSATVRAHLTALFRRYGLPRAILCDNGPPWGGCGWSQATGLQVWLMQVGVQVLHGRPYHPQTQGKDERFHRTLNVELLQGRRFADLPVCQSRFDDWRRVYNEQRPHEALDLAVPASRYQASSVCFPEQVASAGVLHDRPGAPGGTGRHGALQRTPDQAQPMLCRPCQSPSAPPERTASGKSFSCGSPSRRLASAMANRTSQPSRMSPNTCQLCLRSKQGKAPLPSRSHRYHRRAQAT